MQLARQPIDIRAPYLAQIQRGAASSTTDTGFAREEAQRQPLTKLFTAYLDTYEEQAKADELTDDLAVTYANTMALNSELATGKKMTAPEEATLRPKDARPVRAEPDFWADADKQSVHETLVITTMLAVVGHVNAMRDNDQASQALFRDVAREDFTTLTNATLVDLRNTRSASSQN
jgi:hypothetical protein